VTPILCDVLSLPWGLLSWWVGSGVEWCKWASGLITCVYVNHHLAGVSHQGESWVGWQLILQLKLNCTFWFCKTNLLFITVKWHGICCISEVCVWTYLGLKLTIARSLNTNDVFGHVKSKFADVTEVDSKLQLKYLLKWMLSWKVIICVKQMACK
jgi:hypothetical protein